MSWTHSALIAEVYNLDKPVGHSYGDVEYYTAALRGVTGPVLELACGNGRVLVPLLKAGYDMAGLDQSPHMIEICRRNADDLGYQPPLHVGDMANFQLPSTFAAIVVPSGSVKDLDGREAFDSALASCREALRPGGLLVMDVAPPVMAGATTGPMRLWRRDDVLWTLQCVHLDFDSARNQVTEFLRYEKWRDGELLTTELHTFCIQHRSPDEVSEALVRAGFHDIHVTAGYNPASRPAARDDDWTFHAIRP